MQEPSVKNSRSSEYYRDNKRLCKKTLKAWGDISVSDVTKKMVFDLILAEIKRCRKEGLTYSRPNKLFAVLARLSIMYQNISALI